jgi:hypothetical protein
VGTIVPRPDQIRALVTDPDQGASVSQSDSDSDAIAQASAGRQTRGNGTANAVPTAMRAASNQLVRRAAIGFGISTTKSSSVNRQTMR